MSETYDIPLDAFGDVPVPVDRLPTVTVSLTDVPQQEQPAPAPAAAATSPVEALAAPLTPVEAAPLPPPEQPFDLYSLLASGRGRHHLERIDPDFRSRLEIMLKEAPPEVRDAVRLNSGFRFSYRREADAAGVDRALGQTQDEIWAEALAKYGSPEAARKWAAPPERSRHNKGVAYDLLYNSEDRPTSKRGIAARDYIHKNADRYGLHFPMGHEPWHIEPKWARSNAVPAPRTVIDAIDNSVRQTGASRDFMVRLARAEAFNPKTGQIDPNLRAGTSSAGGLFQYTDAAWEHDTRERKWAALYGLGANPDRFNPEHAALMAGRRVVEISRALTERLGRSPTDAEMYATYVLGEGGGPRFIAGAAADPNQPGTALVGRGVAAANRSIFHDKTGNARTASQVIAEFGRRIGAGAPVVADPASRTDQSSPFVAQPPVSAAPPPAPNSPFARSAREAQRIAAGEENPGFWDMTWRSLTSTELTARIGTALGDRGVSPDPSYAPTKEDLEAIYAGIPTDMIARAGVGVSQAHDVAIAGRLRSEMQIQQDLASAGWTGTGAQLVAAMADPVSIGVGLASGGLASAASSAAKLGYVGSKLAQAAGGAAGNVAVDGALQAFGGPGGWHDLMVSASVGALFGAAFGPIARNPHTADGAADLAANIQRTLTAAMEAERATAAAEAAARMGTIADSVSPAALAAGHAAEAPALPVNFMRAAKAFPAANDPLARVRFDAIADPRGRVDAADVASFMLGDHGNLSAARSTDVRPEVLSDKTYRAIQDASAPHSKFESQTWRKSISGQLASSENPLVRMLGGTLFYDRLGKKGMAASEHSADEAATILFRRLYGRWQHGMVPAFAEWQTAKGMGVVERGVSAGYDDFMDEVTTWVRLQERAPAEAAKLHPSVQKAGKAYSDIMADMRFRMQNPQHERFGTLGESLAGAETLTENRSYVHRVYSAVKIDKAIEAHGYDAVVRTIATAIKRGTPEIDDDIATKIAQRIEHIKYTRALGVDDRLERIFSNADVATLKDILTKDALLDGADIDRLIAKLRMSEPARTQNLKRRLVLDESAVDPAGTGLRMLDLLENNADRLMVDYLRRNASRVALGEQRIINPLNGEVVMNGIKSDADFNTWLRRIEQWGKENGMSPEKIKLDLDNLKVGYDRLVGYPDPTQLNQAAEWMRAIRTWNFPLRMTKLAFAVMADAGKMISAGGLTTFVRAMKPYRRIVEDIDGIIQKNGVHRYVEAWLGTGTDPLRVVHSMILDDAGPIRAHNRGRVVDKVQLAGDAMTHFTSHVSGATYIDTQFKLAATSIIAQKFADIATKRAPKKWELARLRDFGIDHVTAAEAGPYAGMTMLDRVLQQVRKNFTIEKGALFGDKITKINLDAWADREAQSAFNMALYRWSRHIVQENNGGDAHRWMSHPIAQTLLQYRSFAITAWENQLLHSIVHHDGRAAADFMWSLFTGGLIYSIQTHLEATGRSDREEFIEKRLGDPMKFGLAVFQRSGVSSLLPMIADTTLMFTPAGPQFMGRSSGQPSDIVFGNPTFGLFNDVKRASQGLLGTAFGDRQLNQQDVRALPIPLVTMMGLGNLFSYMLSDLPEKP